MDLSMGRCLKIRGLVEMTPHTERQCADTVGTVLVSWAGHFQC